MRLQESKRREEPHPGRSWLRNCSDRSFRRTPCWARSGSRIEGRGPLSVNPLCQSGLSSLNLFIYFWLCWVPVSVRGLSLVVASGGHSSTRCAGLSLSRPLLLRSTGSRCAGSVVVAHGLSCSAARGILPDQDPNPPPLHWQADSQPLRHQGSPWTEQFRDLLLRMGSSSCSITGKLARNAESRAPPQTL